MASAASDEKIHASVGIIGAGPAGTATALRLGQLGVDRVVIVDRTTFPRDKTCGSAISPKGLAVLAALSVEAAVNRHAYTINALRLVTPKGHDLVASSPADAAIICNRRILDDLLLQRATALGVRLLQNFDATHLLQRGDHVVGFRSTDGREVRAEYTVVADGAHTRFACERGPKQLIQAIMGWWEGVPFRSHQIEMIFDRLVAPYYGWLFPETPDRVNIGICYRDTHVEQNARQMFQQFLDRQFRDRLSNARQVGAWKGHPISYAVRVGRLTSPGRIVVGEAGRMTHPATAEGIYQGMRSGMLAAEAIASILKRNVEAEDALRDYERACRKAFAMSFMGADVWQRLVSSGGLDFIAGLMKHPRLSGYLARGMAQM